MVDAERLERYLRALAGLWLVGFVLVALFSPPHPLAFLLGLVPAWLGATVAAWYLVYRGGYEQLRASPLYDPALPTSKATALFAGVAIAAKLALTVTGARLLPGDPIAYHWGASVVALVVGYVVSFGRRPARTRARAG